MHRRNYKRTGPSPAARADAVTADLLARFGDGTIAQPMATTLLKRAAADTSAPVAGWSLLNQLAVYCSGTEDARGYGQWQDVGRQVRKGSKAVYILRPLKGSRWGTDSDGERVRVTFSRGFVGQPVFRLEDTDGDALAAPADYAPAELPALLPVAERLGLKVSWLPAATQQRWAGRYCPSGKWIQLATYDTRTFLHELAHGAHDALGLLTGQTYAHGEAVAEVSAAVLASVYEVGADYSGTCHSYLSQYGQPLPLLRAALADVHAVCSYVLGLADDSPAVPAA